MGLCASSTREKVLTQPPQHDDRKVGAPPEDDEDDEFPPLVSHHAVFDTYRNSRRVWKTSDLDELFRTFDPDRSGTLDAAEFANMMGTLLGDELSGADCMKLLAMLDQNGDGQINLREFRALWRLWMRPRKRPKRALVVVDVQARRAAHPAASHGRLPPTTACLCHQLPSAGHCRLLVSLPSAEHYITAETTYSILTDPHHGPITADHAP